MEYDSERIKFVFSDDNSKEIIEISIITDMEGTPTEINGLLDQSDIISKFKLIERIFTYKCCYQGYSRYYKYCNG